MTRARVILEHEIPDRAPLQVAPGDKVEVGEPDGTWPAFVFVVTADGEGWVPERYLDIQAGTVREAYDTTELAAAVDDELTIVRRDDESGWHWCRDAAGRQGWVPIDCLIELPGWSR